MGNVEGHKPHVNDAKSSQHHRRIDVPHMGNPERLVFHLPGDLPSITNSCLADLKTLFKTSGETFIYAANGHGAWEAALTNVLSRGDQILVLESGRFALGWGEMGAVIGLDVEILPGSWRHAVDPAKEEARLKAGSRAFA